MSGATGLRIYRHAVALVVLGLFSYAGAATSKKTPKAAANSDAVAVLWTDPGDIRSRNLFWGPGGEKDQPQPPFEFIEEDLHGSNPKFDVKDASGTKWRLKMGLEVKPEVAASRLLWAIGYSANENYFVPLAHVDKLPTHLHRGQKLAGHDGDVPNVRLQRRPDKEKRVGDWDWRHNPFVGTREFNGLRVMMALLRDWDLYPENNAVLETKKDSSHQIYEVTDVGTAFGARGRGFHESKSKGNLDEYRRGRLIAKAGPEFIDTHFPAGPPLTAIFDVPFYLRQSRARWIGNHIPRADAKWIGSLLSQLSADQIHDAFRAAGYPPDLIEGFSQVLMSRIQELNSL